MLAAFAVSCQGQVAITKALHLSASGYLQDSACHYFIKDCQGNVRAVADQNGTPEEINNYYPYGGLMAANSHDGVQPCKYSGKELDRENGLDLYDFSARLMDPMLPRFTCVDPLAEKYYGISPYAYCAGNPICYVDPSGMDVWEIDETGDIVNYDENRGGYDTFYLVEKDKDTSVRDKKSLIKVGNLANILYL